MSFPTNLVVLVGSMIILRAPELNLLPIFTLIFLKQPYHSNSLVAHGNLTWCTLPSCPWLILHVWHHCNILPY